MDSSANSLGRVLSLRCCLSGTRRNWWLFPSEMSPVCVHATPEASSLEHTRWHHIQRCPMGSRETWFSFCSIRRLRFGSFNWAVSVVVKGRVWESGDPAPNSGKLSTIAQPCSSHPGSGTWDHAGEAFSTDPGIGERVYIYMSWVGQKVHSFFSFFCNMSLVELSCLSLHLKQFC